MLKILIFILLFGSKVFGSENVGARAFALKSYVAVANDAWTIFYNPAGLANLKSRELSFSYIPAKFGLSELSEKSIAFYEPSLPFKIGFGFKTFGFELYKENIFKFSIAYGFEIFNFGLNLCYNFVSIKNYGKAGAFSADLGFFSRSLKSIRFGFVLKNLVADKIGKAKERMPKEIEFGFAFLPYDNLIISASAHKEINFREGLKYGLEYTIANIVMLRFGLSNYPIQYSGGIGVKLSIFQFDYGVDNHQLLGLTHQITLTAKFERK
ncbi:MAG: hypothetical protein RMJ81_05845 [Candidatus Kryptonium sp.]|nr:hypothetical protein [Candidatus Kryptonium sp.]MCX7763225.1 hypothetical protein [Candidatus Kryptonium sp.]MDW8109161.1 hypothetical protein [Candidatus Kryptonium sp.]